MLVRISEKLVSNGLVIWKTATLNFMFKKDQYFFLLFLPYCLYLILASAFAFMTLSFGKTASFTLLCKHLF